ncbi:MAG: HAMP domain-containing histidine kinase [Deltaproteobacteria bacterium]|nr:HAMP domain-containing histidine kinase [Deltaproteobacteria bacterium]
MRNFLVRRPAWLSFLSSPSQRLVGVFLIFILLPGTFFGVFALRVLRQERQLVRQRTHERLERIAKEIGRNLDSEFQRWEETVRLAVREGTLDTSFFPEIIQQALEQPGCGVLLSLSEEGLETFPAGALLYVLPSVPAPQTLSNRLPVNFVEAESLEIEQKDYKRAILAYRSLLASADTKLRPLMLQRLARTLRKDDRLDEAADAYRDLRELDTLWIGGLPSDLIAQSELCSLAAERGDMIELAAMAFALYRDLAGGKWLLDKPRYLYYSECCRSWCRESQVEVGDFNQIQTMEERKLALSRAAEELLNEPRRILTGKTDTHLAFWHSNQFTEVVLSESFLRLHWWPRIISAKGEDIDAALYSTDGYALFGSPPMEIPSFAMMHDIRIDEMPWLIQVWSSNPAAIYADMRQRQNLSLVILVFVTALLVFGSYITVRIVRRELEISRMRADFVSTVSHEFRSPLTGIRHLGEMLLDGRVIDRKKQHHYFKMIVQESDRLTRLVENILDFSRIEEGRKEYRIEPLNTSRWLRRLVADFETEITADGVSIETDISEGLPTISADGEALGSAVHNLLDNAVKYSPGVKVVWLASEAADGEVKITVRDRGVGISEHDRKHIFDRFYRADGEISKRVKGAGLGLNLVRHIVTVHGGKVECESRIGEGSTFSIRLPVVSITGGG